MPNNPNEEPVLTPVEPTHPLPEIMGAIERKWRSLGGPEGPLGQALSEETATFDSVGRFQSFNGGIISWHPSTGAHVVQGAIADRWLERGREKFGYPTTDETSTPDGRGRFSHFRSLQVTDQAESSIYWTPETGAHILHGGIRTKWASMGWERSLLGYPVTDELPTPDGRGWYNHFQGGAIYWTEETGAHEVHGDIYNKWASLSWERSFLGYPTTDEVDFPEGGRVSVFERGAIYWWPDTGPIELNDVIVHYTGLFCFRETTVDQWPSNSDEPYVVLGMVGPNGSWAAHSRIYDDVDSGESQPDLLEIYRGKPGGLAIDVLLMEHDSENPDKYKSEMQDAAAAGFKVLGTAALSAIPIIGPVIALPGSLLLSKVGAAVGKEIHRLLHLENDTLGRATLAISAKQMVVLAARTPNSTFNGIGFKLETPNISGDGATYRVYFGLVPA